MLECENIDEVWFVVSPQNPFKESDDLIDANIRIKMVELATQNQNCYKAEGIELTLPIPSYTIDSLSALKNKYNNCEFTIIMGADNINRFHQWKAADQIGNNHKILVYPRPDFPIDKARLPKLCKITEAPLIEISSTDIRNWIKEGKSAPFLMPEEVYSFIKNNQLYQ